MSRFDDDDDGREPESIGDYVCIHETDAAILVKPRGAGRFDDDGKLWVPKSAVHDDSQVNEKGDEGDLVVMRWWAEENT